MMMKEFRANEEVGYRGRIAPTPTGFMHLGHARTFLKAQERAKDAGGSLLLRVEDLDRERCKEEFTGALIEDLRWAGLDWEEGPDVGGDCGPYTQSKRGEVFRNTWNSLRANGSIFPCRCSRKDVQAAVTAPHESGVELIYPGICRDWSPDFDSEESAEAVNWRFRVPDGETIEFVDENLGLQRFVAGRDFGDFLVWRKDGIPSYELAVVADDIAMGITEVVRGEDLLLSTARQILLYRSLGCAPPTYFHCPLVLDESGRRLAKRHQSLGLRELRRRGADLAALLGG
ncbi:MAG: glutamyl/glutaminyl-tRNA synthetase [Candidatus Pelagisphaera sp.]|jgi:glutamyl/glutaminyl-tRNA synthetase